jgi:hypothetical protein
VKIVRLPPHSIPTYPGRANRRCDAGQSNLPNVCSVCDHSPLDPSDCKPNSALRTTVAVFLRTAEKKHALAQEKLKKQQATEQQQKPPLQPFQQPIQQTPTPEAKAIPTQQVEQPTPSGPDEATTAATPTTPVQDGAIGQKKSPVGGIAQVSVPIEF